MAAPQQLIPALAKVQDTTAICPSRPPEGVTLAIVNVPQTWASERFAGQTTVHAGSIQP